MMNSGEEFMALRKAFVVGLVALGCVYGQVWSAAKANAWYARQPWLVGSNYIPANAINQLEMWQADTFDPKTIDAELKLASGIGMNTMRVFLHDLLWQQDGEGFRKRIETFLAIASRHGIRPMFVLFDSCWDPHPTLGRQRAPKPGIHNSGWVQSPGASALGDRSQHARIEKYVRGVVGAFANDGRVLAWDLWNEPDNPNTSSYGKAEPKDKEKLVLDLLPKVYEWARSAKPSQPLTSGVWRGDWSSPEKLSAIERIQVYSSDVITFHDYSEPGKLEQRIRSLEQYKRPILCTEYMARGAKSTFEGALPVAAKYGVAMINWGLVAGKTQTFLPWDSWQRPYTDREPSIWFHEVFRTDGKRYKVEEVEFIRKITEQVRARKKAA
jgi:hypothetical protein